MRPLCPAPMTIASADKTPQCIVREQGGPLPGIDVAAALVLALAIGRGLWLGLVREAFSLAGLGAAAFAVWRFGDAANEALAARVGGALPGAAVHAIATAGLGLAVVLAAALVGRAVRRTVRFAGLGLADRIAGGCLGAAEGAIVVALVVGGVTFVLGRDHPWLASSNAVAAYERLREYAPAESTPAGGARDVASPAARPAR